MSQRGSIGQELGMFTHKMEIGDKIQTPSRKRKALKNETLLARSMQVTSMLEFV